MGYPVLVADRRERGIVAYLGGGLRCDFQLLLLGQLRPLLRPPKKEFAVRVIVGASGIPLALAGMF